MKTLSFFGTGIKRCKLQVLVKCRKYIGNVCTSNIRYVHKVPGLTV
jgi:hypothetical protein